MVKVLRNYLYSDDLKSCAGSPVVLCVQGGSAYQYRWYKDDALNGITADSVVINQSGKYKVEVSS